MFFCVGSNLISNHQLEEKARRYREAEDFLKETIARLREFASHWAMKCIQCYLEGNLISD